MPRDHPAWKPATLHGALNTLATLTTMAAVGKAKRRSRLACATALVMAGSAIGGELVFRLGWRVRPAEEIEIVESQLRQDHLERYVDRAREEVEEFERSKTYLPGGARHG
jgi:hypothetical protein